MEKIVFDLWGTLAYLRPGEDFGIAIAKELGVKKEDYHNLVKKFWFRRNLEAKEFAKILVNETESDNVSLEYLTKQIQSPYGRHALYQDSVKSLERLSQDRELLLVSDTSSLGKQMFYDLEICSFFNRLYFSCDEGKIKEKGLYSQVLKDLEIFPQEMLVIGDSQKADYNLPLSLGFRAILLDRNNKCSEGQSIENLGELK